MFNWENIVLGNERIFNPIVILTEEEIKKCDAIASMHIRRVIDKNAVGQNLQKDEQILTANQMHTRAVMAFTKASGIEKTNSEKWEKLTNKEHKEPDCSIFQIRTSSTGYLNLRKEFDAELRPYAFIEFKGIGELGHKFIIHGFIEGHTVLKWGKLVSYDENRPPCNQWAKHLLIPFTFDKDQVESFKNYEVFMRNSGFIK